MSGPGLTFSIKNSFYHIFLYHYFKNAFFVYSTEKREDIIEHFSYIEIARQKLTFGSIFRKVCGPSLTEPSLLNEAHKFFHLKYAYPLKVTLNHDETFWFEFIINKRFDSIYETLNKEQLFAKEKLKTESKDVLKTFNTPEAVDYIRKKFIEEEKIKNTPEKVGFK